jgi:uncharacterized protein (TIGR02271 family)
MQTSTRTIVGVFDDYATAQRAADRLLERGFSRDEVHVTSARDYAGDAASGNTGMAGRPPSETTGGGISGFFHRLFGMETDEEERGRYSEAIRRGSAVVAVKTSEERQDTAADILNEFNPIDMDERASSWQDRGYERYDAGSAPYTDEEVARERERYRSASEQRTIPVVKEELRVGKRAVQKGAVRIYNDVHDEPVEQQVELREEHVRVDRRTANRPATEGDVHALDEVIEVREMSEEPVVEKQTRVVEEVVIGKETKSRTETVRGTIRKTDVNVERTGAGEDDFRRDFQTRYGSDPSANYESYAPAYQYGSRMASDSRYAGRRWEDVESTLKTDYERNNPNSTWDRVRGSVRYGWEKVTGKR